MGAHRLAYFSFTGPVICFLNSHDTETCWKTCLGNWISLVLCFFDDPEVEEKKD
jgi:hypothetical protein